MPGIKIHFWGWDEPVLTKAVAELTRGWSGGELNLTRTAVVVPTMEASRRLREALALDVSRRAGAVVAPHVWHPERAVEWNLPGQGVASALQERLAWSRVLMQTKLDQLHALFPQPPEDLSLSWASSVAETLRALRHALGAGGLTIADARLAIETADARWRDLAVLEAAYLRTLRSWKLDDAQELKHAAAHEPVLPPGVDRVLVFAVPDAPPLFQTWLRELPDTIEAHIFVQAPESERPKFDASGTPLVSAWGDDADVVLPLPESRMHRATGPEDQARRAGSLLAELARAGSSVAIGVCDVSLTSVLEANLVAAGARVFNPAGRSARQHVLVQVLRDGWHVKHQPAWRVWLPFLRHDDVLRALAARTRVLPFDILSQLDEFHARHLPATIEDALALSASDAEFEDLHSVLKEAVARSESWAHPSSAEAVREFLGWIYGTREFDSAKEADRHFGDLFSKAVSLAAETDASGGSPEEFSLALDAIEDVVLGEVHGEADLVLHGWLELLWEPARGMIITGASDEHLPGVVTMDPFLPDKSRQKLGLACQSRRRARDAYLLRAMCEQRRVENSLHVIFGRANADGDALRPSRLLLDCEGKSLPARVKRLFPDETAGPRGEPRPARTMAFPLKPELKKWKGGRVSPSQLKDYLACPFRFYLKRVLGLEAVDGSQRELTPADLGNVLHRILKSFVHSAVADSRDAGEIAGWLLAQLDREAATCYGSQPLFSVALQVESMRQRLRAFADVQSGLRGEGWRIIAAEEEITPEWGAKLGEVTLNGKIDRIDRNEKSGTLRVIDYKTSQLERGPAGAHVKKASPLDLDDEHNRWKCFDDKRGKSYRWLDLQLPLYALAVAARHPDAGVVDAAYICLPAAVDGIGLKEWKRDSKSGAVWGSDLLESAKKCAEEAVRRMSAGAFWPPSDDLKYDDFGDLLLGDAERAVCPPETWEAPS